MWQSVICCLLAGIMMWLPGLFGIMTILDTAGACGAVLLRRGYVVPAGYSGAMEPFPFLAGTAGALVGACRISAPACWPGCRR